MPTSAFELQGAGFRDFTRIAHSDPGLWVDILSSNRKAIAAPLQAVGRALASLSDALEADDAEAVEKIIATARAALSKGGERGSCSADAGHVPPTVG